MLGRAQVAQPRREVEHRLGAFERAGDITGRELPEHDARISVIDQPVVAAVERPHPAEKARIVEEDHRQRERDERKRRQQAAQAHAHQQAEHDRDADQGEAGLDQLAHPDARARREPHRKLVRDRHAEDAPPDVVRRQRAALHGGVHDGLEAFA